MKTVGPGNYLEDTILKDKSTVGHLDRACYHLKSVVYKDGNDAVLNVLKAFPRANEGKNWRHCHGRRHDFEQCPWKNLVTDEAQQKEGEEQLNVINLVKIKANTLSYKLFMSYKCL